TPSPPGHVAAGSSPTHARRSGPDSPLIRLPLSPRGRIPNGFLTTRNPFGCNAGEVIVRSGGRELGCGSEPPWPRRRWGQRDAPAARGSLARSDGSCFTGSVGRGGSPAAHLPSRGLMAGEAALFPLLPRRLPGPEPALDFGALRPRGRLVETDDDVSDDEDVVVERLSKGLRHELSLCKCIRGVD